MVVSIDVTSPVPTWDLQPLSAIIPEWSTQKDRLYGSTTQQIAWVSHWQRHVNTDCFCVVSRSAECLELVVTLEVVKQGPLKIALFPGGTHANENFPCISSEFAQSNARECLGRLKAIVKEKRPDIDAIYLHRQVHFLNGLANPLLDLASATPTDIVLCFVLDPDFQVVLDARDGTKKQKKIRKAARRLEERGGWQYEIITNLDEARIALDRFFVLKAHRLAGKGILNVFAQAEVQTFFRAIFSQSLEQSTSEFELHVLKVAGEAAAITGNSILGDRLTVQFTAVDDTDPSVSHGEFHYFQMISNACARGIKTFSFGVGDERFKRSWCDIEIPQYNSAIALTLKGAAASQIDNLKTSAKRWVKSNKRVYEFLKNRRKSRGPNPSQ